jgi:hypothetical protein
MVNDDHPAIVAPWEPALLEVARREPIGFD